MATVVFAAIGTALGGPVGGAIGALIGQQVDSVIFAPPAREGPRLRELAVTTSSYGQPIARHLGRMRVGGTIIWATPLKESSQRSGGGKGRPAVTTYSYSASFAVALSSAPLAGVGRIWADGNLLRGTAGDLKVGGRFRFYEGYGDQPIDPLLAAAEGAGASPAYRGIAYAVFEDLQLADFGNRIPALSFEVFGAEAAIDIAALIGDTVAAVSAPVPLPEIAGISVEGPVAETLGMIAPVFSFASDVAGAQLMLRGDPVAAQTLRETTLSVDAQGFGGRQGYARKRLPPAEAPLGALRYYDVERDYQASVQRANVPLAAGAAPSVMPRTVELPVALAADVARGLVDRGARRANWARQSLVWRTAEIDPAIGPGALVRVPGQAGLWRVADWEWRASGVELSLWRTPGLVPSVPADGADAGRAARAPDLANGPTLLRAFELPWDGAGAGSSASVYVAASSYAPGWGGAALFADDGSGALQPLDSSVRRRCIMGNAVEALAGASSLLPDRASTLTVELLADDMDLPECTGRQLAMGANRALLGAEIIQFARALPLGHRRWRLSGLLRGRGGTEPETAGHVAGEPFVLLDDRLVPIADPLAAQGGIRQIAALGLADAEPVRGALQLRGMGLRPLCPVHPWARQGADGALTLGWTRRARGAWTWQDGADVPLHEEAEAYEVVVGPEQAPLALWQTAAPQFTIAAAQLQALRGASPGAAVQVRQRGSYGVSVLTLITSL